MIRRLRCVDRNMEVLKDFVYVGAKKVRLWLEGGMKAVSFQGLLTTGGRRSDCFIADDHRFCQTIILKNFQMD